MTFWGPGACPRDTAELRPLTMTTYFLVLKSDPDPVSLYRASCMGKRARSPPRSATPDFAPGDYGTFNGPVRARWLQDGRFMALCVELEFNQRGGSVWCAPVGARTDGASIPRIFWAVIGGPFEGKYRDAAVNHDYECCVKARPWRDVHRMFFDGMMANGEDRWRANLMYFAVYHFGPRWPKSDERSRTTFMEGDIARAASYFQQYPQTPLEEIEGLTRPKLRRHLAAVPRSIRGAKDLSDNKKIQPVERKDPCIEPGTC